MTELLMVVRMDPEVESLSEIHFVRQLLLRGEGQSKKIQNAVTRVTTKKKLLQGTEREDLKKSPNTLLKQQTTPRGNVVTQPSSASAFSYEKWHFETLIIGKYLIGIAVFGKHIWRERGEALRRTKIILGRKVLKARDRSLPP